MTTTVKKVHELICENYEITIGGDSALEGAVMTFDMDDIQPWGLAHISYFIYDDTGIHIGFAADEEADEVLPVLFPAGEKEHLILDSIRKKYGRIFVAALVSNDDEVNIAFSREMLFS